MKGFRRHPRPKGFKGALTGELSLLTVGVTVLPKQVLAKHSNKLLSKLRKKRLRVKRRREDHKTTQTETERNKEEAEAPKLGRACSPRAKGRNCNPTNNSKMPKKTEKHQNEKR